MLLAFFDIKAGLVYSVYVHPPSAEETIINTNWPWQVLGPPHEEETRDDLRVMN
jgi:hypothetical protein